MQKGSWHRVSGSENDVLVITEIICYRFTYKRINICIFTFSPSRLFSSRYPKVNNYEYIEARSTLRWKEREGNLFIDALASPFIDLGSVLSPVSCVFMTKSCENDLRSTRNIPACNAKCLFHAGLFGFLISLFKHDYKLFVFAFERLLRCCFWHHPYE